MERNVGQIFTCGIDLSNLDWIKLHNDIKAFADTHQMQTKESDLSYGDGTITTHQLEEGTRVFYELKHAKPIAEYGSKLRIYSRTERELSIKVKAKWIGKPSVKSTMKLSNSQLELLKELGAQIGSFQWTTETHNLGWPEELYNMNVLVFECKQIDQAVGELDRVRNIHLTLLERAP